MNKLSTLAETLIPSEIIKLGNEINEKIKEGNKIYNFTIGDFNPEIFPIPVLLENEIVNAYRNKKTNYPPANGIPELRNAVSGFIKRIQGLDYSADAILISGGGRPLIYATYRTICDRNDKVIYPIPSWNNNHYTHFIEGEHICVVTNVENNFLPTADELIPHFNEASLLALCSPLNPTGTAYTKEQLSKICEAVIAENKQRSADKKPLYVLFDQIYSTLVYDDTIHYDPVSLFHEMRPYTIFIDGISKAFCATGVRVGWAFGPTHIINKMKGILSHVGAWSPMAEQTATAAYLNQSAAVDAYLNTTKAALHLRLHSIYEGVIKIKNKGYAIDIIEPKAAMYLTLRFALKGLTTPQNKVIETTADISSYLLNEASLALVPFSAFGSDKESEWYRLSVGTCRLEDIADMLEKLEVAMDRLF